MRRWRFDGLVLRRGGWRVRARMLLVSGILGCALAWSATTPPPGAAATATYTLACGLGNTPTMMANNTPALFYPIPVGKNIPGNQPAGIFAPDYAANAAIAFTDDLSSIPNAPDPSTLKWRWNFGDSAGYVLQQNPTHTYKKAGTYDVRAEIYLVTDGKGAWVTNPSFDSAEIDVVTALPPNPPIARVTESAPIAFFGQSITFDASGSQSTDGSALTYFWNFNDGETATGERVSHQFVLTGKSFVSLTVTDARGAKGIATIPIIAPKSQLLSSTSSPAPHQTITLTVPPADVPNVPGQPASYKWDFGDGSPVQISTQPSVRYSYAHTRTYIVTMQVSFAPSASPSASVEPFDGLVVTVVTPPAPPWRYYAGGAAVALGILISLLAAVRAQRRQLALENERELAREQRQSWRGGPPPRAGRVHQQSEYAGRNDWYDDDPPPRTTRGGTAAGRTQGGRAQGDRAQGDRAQGGASGRRDDPRRGSPPRQPPRRPPPRDDRW